MDIQQIKYFLALADELHFWKTAEKINISQSALSRHIQSLERELNVKLFERTKREVKLTAAGQFLKDTWKVELNRLSFIHNSAREISLGAIGTIKIAYPDSISASILPDIVQKITHAFPYLKIELIQLPYENQYEALVNHKVDLVFSRSTNSYSEIITKKFHTENLTLAVPQDHHLFTANDISAESIRGEKFIIIPDDQSSSYNKLIREVLNYYSANLDVYLHCEFGSTILALIRRGIGIAILPYSYKMQGVTDIRFIDLPFQTDLSLNWRKGDHNPILLNILALL